VRKILHHLFENSRAPQIILGALAAIVFIAIVILAFSWDSLLIWIISGEGKKEFAFWAVFGLAALAVSALIIVIMYKRRR